MPTTKIRSRWSNGDLIFEDLAGAQIAKLDGTNARFIARARLQARSESFDLDNGAGVTVDRVLIRPTGAITITAARIVYDDATTGTVAAGNAKIGTTVGGAEIVAATAYGDAQAVGTTTAMAIVSGAVPAGTPVIVRHTGVAATQAGRAVVEIEYTADA